MVSINLERNRDKKSKHILTFCFVRFPGFGYFFTSQIFFRCWPLPCCYCYLPWIHLTDFKDAIYTRFTVCCLFLCHIQLSLNVYRFGRIYSFSFTHIVQLPLCRFVTYIQPRNFHTRTQTINYMEIKTCFSICRIEWILFCYRIFYLSCASAHDIWSYVHAIAFGLSTYAHHLKRSTKLQHSK